MACTVQTTRLLMGGVYAYEAAVNGKTFDRPVIKTNAPMITAENVAEYKAMFIDGQPEYDFNDLAYCVLLTESFEELKNKYRQ